MFKPVMFASFFVLVAGFQNCSPVEFQRVADAPSQAPLNQMNHDDQPLPVVEPKFPAIGGVASIAFEDSYPNAGDADFNDFVANYSIREVLNSKAELEKVVIKVTPRHKGAHYDHAFVLNLGSHSQEPRPFKGASQVIVRRYDSSMQLLNSEELRDPSEVVVFKSTSAVLKPGADSASAMQPTEIAEVEIAIDQTAHNQRSGQKEINLTHYRFQLKVKETSSVVDLVDVNHQALDPAGYPFGLIIPTNWKFPRESVKIDLAYPQFSMHRQWLEDRASGKTSAAGSTENWFLTVSKEAEKYLSK